MEQAKPPKLDPGEVRVSIDWRAVGQRAARFARERGEAEVGKFIEEAAATGKIDPAQLAAGLLAAAFRRRPG